MPEHNFQKYRGRYNLLTEEVVERAGGSGVRPNVPSRSRVAAL